MKAKEIHGAGRSLNRRLAGMTVLAHTGQKLKTQPGHSLATFLFKLIILKSPDVPPPPPQRTLEKPG